MNADDYDVLKRRVIEKKIAAIQALDSSLVLANKVNEIKSFTENSVFHRLFTAINDNEKYVRGFMGDRSKLDGHKLASCICGAIRDIKPLERVQGEGTANRQLPMFNEVLALFSAVEFLRPFIISHFLDKHPKYAPLRQRIRNEFKVSFTDTIRDKKAYPQNLIAAIHRSRDFDIFAYATIFYHIDLYNIDKLEKLCEKWSSEQV